MSTVFKGLTRPALIRGLGVPLYPFLFTCVLCVLLGVWIHEALYFLIIVGIFVIRKIMKIDERYFELIYLRYLVMGNPVSNQKYHAVHVGGNDYDRVDLSDVENFMKLSDQASLEKLIPYSSHITDDLVLSQNRDLIATFELSGAYFECVSENDLSLMVDQFNTLIRSYEGKPVTFYTHRIRNKKQVKAEFNSPIPFANRVMNAYYGSLTKSDFYQNRLFLTVCFKPFSLEEKVAQFLSSKKKNKQKDKSILAEPINEMNEICARLTNYLSRYKAHRLGVYTENDRVFSSQLSFYQYLLSGQWQPVRVTNSPFYTYLGGKDIFFGGDAGQISISEPMRYFRIIEIKDYFQDTESGIFDSLMYMPVEYTLTTSFTPLDKREAIQKLDDQREKLEMTDDAAKSQITDLEVAVDMVSSGYLSMGHSHLTLCVFADSPDELVKNTNMVTGALQDLGLILSYSTLSLGAAFFSQLPGNYTLRPRLSILSSLNYAEMECFHNFFTGKETGNTWGNCLLTLKGSGNDIYHLNYHMTTEYQNFFGKNPTLGHSEILGTSNAGKTVLMMMQACALQQFGSETSFPPNSKVKKQTTIFFDKDRAGEVAIRAMGGDYYKVKLGEPTGWNPFAMPATKRNLIFLKDLIRNLCTLNSEKGLTEYQNKLISDAVERLMQREDRSFGISKLIPLIMEERTEETLRDGLKIRLAAWKQGGEFGWVFDNATDDFDISDKTIFGIDGTEFLEDAILSQVVPFYLIYKITLLADGRRLTLYFDEFWQWLANMLAAMMIYNKLKTGRKLNMVIVFATQSPDELLKSPMISALREQLATHIYLANPNAKKSEYVDGLQVNELYFNKIKIIDPLSRRFLVVKNPQRKGDSQDFAAFASLELGEAAYYLPILSASTEQLEIFDEIYQDGMKPDEWIDIYLERANQAA
ncbi:VirB3 family type IV secretion system protein [Proteus mirabilis]|uniref:VirB4 family type IV secretion/conjugal transfer ATPase n=1 Tax=Proteus mirabilis TaxID=584 RepID=UPI001B39A8ED|nr:VirB3 family type IV secretion system protein [Proteus mirabilis]MBQ0656053.1 VirB3 family type IV secretion system protein [Proteus mirabilis]